MATALNLKIRKTNTRESHIEQLTRDNVLKAVINDILFSNWDHFLIQSVALFRPFSARNRKKKRSWD